MIYQEITDEYHFWNWLGTAGSYKDQFSLEGAKAVQAWYEELSESADDETSWTANISFDPIGWCIEWTEYDTVAEAYKEHYGDDTDLPIEQRRTDREQQLEYFTDNTTVIELDNGHIIVGEF